MIKLKTPKASALILYETYILNNTLILLVKRPAKVNIVPLIKNFFVLFKLSPLNIYLVLYLNMNKVNINYKRY